MLQTLKIKNFALIADQTIEFKGGFNVLIGETGAGKSLILDSLSFVLGDKANKLNIRHGEQKMSVQAVFDNTPAIESFLEDNGIDVEDNLYLSRSLSQEGRGDTRINGNIVPASLLRSLSAIMVDTYAQNENIELLKVKNHISILDSYAGLEVKQLKEQVQDVLTSIKQIDVDMLKLGGDHSNRERELELLEYQIKDIENANLKPNEDSEIKEQLDKLSNFEKIHENVQNASQNLMSIDELLSECEHSLSMASKYDDSLLDYLSRLSSAKIEIKDICDYLQNYGDDGFDQSEIDILNKRYDDIKLLKKKYGYSIEEILQYLNKVKEDYDNLLFGEEKLNKLATQKQQLSVKLYSLCQELTNKRRVCAKEIEKNVLFELEQLGFKNCKFKVDFKDLPAIEDAEFTKNGLDEIEFLFSANAGEELKSLSKTISGGEMSRFMLAIKNVFANIFETTTLVFDEVDTGISGEIGQRVAERLARLSKNYQLICITHLCQVTAMADNYIFVKKEVENNKTFTKVSYLNSKEIIEYIAVVSGAEPTEVAIRFATELKQKANEYKKTL